MRGEKVLEKMDSALRWEELLEPAEAMLRVCFMRQWYGMNDPAWKAISMK